MTERSPAMTEFDRVLVESDVPTPALAVDLDIFESNMRDMVARCRAAGVRLVPHAKTHRITEIGTRQIDLGAAGVCVATVQEAVAFAAAGVDRLVLAYPVVGSGLPELVAVADRTRLTVAVDGVDGARELGATFAAAGRMLDVYLIVDSGLGRAGVSPEDAPEVAVAVQALDGVSVTGVMTHEGSVYEATDPADRDARAAAAAELMVRAAAAIRARGVPAQEVSMGASASARAVVRTPGVTEIRPGIFAFNDRGQLGLENVTLDACAVRVVATVVSSPEPGRACIDAGSKSLGQDLMPSSMLRARHPGHGLLLNAPGWRLERLSEEHGWLRPEPGRTPVPLEVGRRVTVVPNHVCTAFFCHGAVRAFRHGVEEHMMVGLDRVARR